MISMRNFTLEKQVITDLLIALCLCDHQSIFSEKQKKVMSDYYLLGLKHTEIAKKRNKGLKRINAIKHQAIRKIYVWLDTQPSRFCWEILG